MICHKSSQHKIKESKMVNMIFLVEKCGEMPYPKALWYFQHRYRELSMHVPMWFPKFGVFMGPGPILGTSLRGVDLVPLKWFNGKHGVWSNS